MHYKCGTCKNSVNLNDDKAILCDICKNWVHIPCNSLHVTHKDYLHYQTTGSEVPWFCKDYLAELFPFSGLENYENIVKNQLILTLYHLLIF